MRRRARIRRRGRALGGSRSLAGIAAILVGGAVSAGARAARITTPPHRGPRRRRRGRDRTRPKRRSAGADRRRAAHRVRRRRCGLPVAGAAVTAELEAGASAGDARRDSTPASRSPMPVCRRVASADRRRRPLRDRWARRRAAIALRVTGAGPARRRGALRAGAVRRGADRRRAPGRDRRHRHRRRQAGRRRAHVGHPRRRDRRRARAHDRCRPARFTCRTCPRGAIRSTRGRVRSRRARCASTGSARGRSRRSSCGSRRARSSSVA